MKTSFLLTTLLSAAVTFVPALSYADDADKAACVDLDEGDDCTRGDGGPGVCIPDESDPDVLTCDDDPSEDGGGGGHADRLGGAATDFFADQFDTAEEGADEVVEFAACWRQFEWAAIEELEAEVGLELQDLAGDGGLLDAVGDVPDGLHDATEPGDIVEQLEVMDVEHREEKGWMTGVVKVLVGV